jgi:hypothetical protein
VGPAIDLSDRIDKGNELAAVGKLADDFQLQVSAGLGNP